MCRTAHAVLSVGICGIQMLVRVFMTFILMLENVFRLILQTMYNFLSFLLQMLSLIPICLVFLATTRLKCFMCGGGGPCPVNRGGGCDCLMSAAAIVLLFFIFRAVGVLDKMFYKIGYVAAPPMVMERFVPTPGSITECSRDDKTAPNTTDTETASDEYDTTNTLTFVDPVFISTTTSTITRSNARKTTSSIKTTTPPPQARRANTDVYYMQDTETEVVTDTLKMLTTLAGHVFQRKRNLVPNIFTDVPSTTVETLRYDTEIYLKNVETEREETTTAVLSRSKERRDVRKKTIPRKKTSVKVESTLTSAMVMTELQTEVESTMTTRLEEVDAVTTSAMITSMTETETKIEESSKNGPLKSTAEVKKRTKSLLDVLKYFTT